MPPLEEGSRDEQPTERPALGGKTSTNIFTSNLNNAPRARSLLGSNIALRGRGLSQSKQ